MYEARNAVVRRGRRPQNRRARRVGAALCAALVLAPAGLAAAGTGGPAAAAGAPAAAPSGATATTTNVTPATSVTTTTGPGTVTTATTTVTTTPTAVTSTTVTSVVPAAGDPPTTTTTVPVGSAGTTITKVPVTTTTTTTVPVASSSTTTVPVASSTTSPTSDAEAGVAVAHFDSTCARPATPDLQDYLDSLPAGSVFRSSTTACYDVPAGIILSKPVTIIGGTFYDPTTVKPTGKGYDGMKPIILIKAASDVTISGVHVLGADTSGVYHSSMVGQAGFKLESAIHATLTDDTSTDTWGDGLELVAAGIHDRSPVTDLTVNGFTSTNAGRQGVTLAEVADSSLNGLDVVSPAEVGIDFQSDLGGRGSANVTISNCSNDKGFELTEYFYGPITISNCTGFHHVTLRSLTSDAPISFVGGTLLCRRIDPQPCIKQFGGSLTFTGVTIDRMPGTYKIKEPAWSVIDGGSLDFVNSPVEEPFGTVSAGSDVAFTK